MKCMEEDYSAIVCVETWFTDNFWAGTVATTTTLKIPMVIHSAVIYYYYYYHYDYDPLPLAANVLYVYMSAMCNLWTFLLYISPAS